MRIRELLGLSLLTACATGAGHPAAGEPQVGITATDTTWIARESVICGEVHGRVLDQAGLQPMARVSVSLDSSSGGVMTDSLGRFRLALPHDENSPIPTRPTFLRVRRIGSMEIRVLLPAGMGYAVEVQLASGGFHVDHLATLRIKCPAFCVPAA
jgi:hypothetical protein